MRSFGNFQRKEYDLALTDVEKVIKLEPQKVDGYHRRAGIYEKMGLLDKAIADQTKAIELATEEYPWRDFLYSIRGDVYFKKGDLQAALDDYSEAIRIKPDRKEHYAKRAKVYRKLNNNALAEVDETKAGENNSTEDSKAPTADKNLPANKTISGGVVNGKALNLVQPVYPPAAKAVKATGAVNVQVTIDENGKVISAKAVSGHPLLKASAESAAKDSTFNPTKLKGEAVKVTGVIVYNFTAE